MNAAAYLTSLSDCKANFYLGDDTDQWSNCSDIGAGYTQNCTSTCDLQECIEWACEQGANTINW